MRKRTSGRSTLFFVWSILCVDRACQGLSLQPRRAWLTQSVASFVTTWMGTSQAVAAAENDKFKLTPPSEDRPQIGLPTATDKNQPLVQGNFHVPVAAAPLPLLPPTIFRPGLLSRFRPHLSQRFTQCPATSRNHNLGKCEKSISSERKCHVSSNPCRKSTATNSVPILEPSLL